MKYIFLVYSFLLLFPIASISQSSENSYKFEFVNPKRKSVSIPFKLVNNLILIPISINNSQNVWFILDTGVNTTLLLDNELVRDTTFDKKILISGLSNAPPINGYISPLNSIKIPKLKPKWTNFIFFKERRFYISQSLGVKVSGIIGFDLFESFVIQINYSSKTIKLTHFHDFEKLKRKKNTFDMDLDIENGKPFLTTYIKQFDKEKVKVRLLIDSGASFALSLYTIKDKIVLPKQYIPAFLGFGLTGIVKGNLVKIEKIDIGGIELKFPIVYFTQRKNVSNILLNKMKRNGNIGGEILSRFYVTFNYRAKKLLLKPNYRIKKGFKYNKSGIHLVNPIINLNVYVIAYVRKNSPAYNSKIKEGDQLISINGINTVQLTMNQVNEMLYSNRKRIYVLILRNGIKMRRVIHLNEFI